MKLLPYVVIPQGAGRFLVRRRPRVPDSITREQYEAILKTAGFDRSVTVLSLSLTPSGCQARLATDLGDRFVFIPVEG